MPRRVQVEAQVMEVDLGDERVLLDLRAGTYFGLNEVGGRIWSLLSQDGCLEGAFRGLQGTYDVSDEVLRADFETFVRLLLSRGLVHALDA